MNTVLNMLYLGLTEKDRLSLIWVFYQLSARVALVIEINIRSSLSLSLSLSLTHITGMQLRGTARPSTVKRRDWNKDPKAKDKI